MRLPTQEPWFLLPLLLRIVVWLFLAHVYDIAVFQDVSWRIATGQGVYEKFSGWLAAYGDGYFAYPPVYAYMLGASGWLADALGGHWWLYQILIKSWMFLADLAAVAFLYRLKPEAARAYWTLWVMPIVAIAQVQPDLWVGLSVLLAYYLARQGRWYATGLALAIGISMKMTPLVIFPFLLYHLVRERKWTAGGQVVIALFMGLCMFWVPYALIFDDEQSFTQVLLFHLSRPASGLNVLVGVRSLLDTALTSAALVGQQVSAGAAISQAFQQVTAVYPFLTLLAFAALAAAALAQRWSLHLVFGLPLLTFLVANKVVHEQYLLHVLPLMLVISPDVVRQFGAYYSAYVVAAGTPLRFLPQEYGLPLTPDALIPASHHAVLGPLVMLGFAAVAGAASLLFSYKLYRLIRDLINTDPINRRADQARRHSELQHVWGAPTW